MLIKDLNLCNKITIEITRIVLSKKLSQVKNSVLKLLSMIKRKVLLH